MVSDSNATFLAFLFWEMCACAYLYSVLSPWATPGVLIKKEVGFWGVVLSGGSR